MELIVIIACIVGLIWLYKRAGKTSNHSMPSKTSHGQQNIPSEPWHDHPASERQKEFIMNLAEEAGWGDEDLDSLTKIQASQRIDALLGKESDFHSDNYFSDDGGDTESYIEEILECIYHPDKVLFLDIETTGLDPYEDKITIIGWSLGGNSYTYVNDGNSKPLKDDIFSNARMMVTFNGINFDEEFLEVHFPSLELPGGHLDLMFLASSMGLRGGQKAIEQSLGINLRTDAKRIDGSVAVSLWNEYILDGNEKSLEKLMEYNQTDITAMGAIFDKLLDDVSVEGNLPDIEFQRWAGPKHWNRVP